MSSISDLIKKIIDGVSNWIERCIPEYEPNAWNDANGIQYNNNCYNYGCDIQTNTYAQPGRAHGITLSPGDLEDCDAVQNGAIADGLKPVNCDEGCGCKDCQHQVALVIWPGVDYHWYRKDQNGKWSHKLGGTPATNLDNSGNLISNPKTADRGNYTLFCGCFCVDKSQVTIN
ncbi:hypothetical protein [Fodinibius halophilus]|uniref:Ig-like domain-containing protein n=1 Tax=Fodinibius halophilus TaxID=1736908 RepID=A0A6M1TC14_9BACT|nr:hypothetical protein [Fodinibius halophilus]NGP89903.1 hypothetical protein [Fodinibius halophilus]